MLQEKSYAALKQNEANQYGIVLVDDHPLMRQALRNLLEKQSDFEILGEASDGEEAVKLASELTPDIMIMDINMPKLSGLEATKIIKHNHPEIIILVLTVHTDEEYVRGLLAAGASGYLVKSIYGDEMIASIRALILGETVLSSSVSLKLIKNTSTFESKQSGLGTNDRLTGKELEILTLAAKGLSNKDIANKLGLSPRTVKAYLADVFLKLNVASRTEAVVLSLRRGIINLNDFDKGLDTRDD